MQTKMHGISNTCITRAIEAHCGLQLVSNAKAKEPRVVVLTLYVLKW